MFSSPRKETYTVAEAAALLGVSRTTVYEQLRQNTFPTPFVRIGARYVIARTPLDALLSIEDMPPVGPTPFEALAFAASPFRVPLHLGQFTALAG